MELQETVLCIAGYLPCDISSTGSFLLWFIELNRYQVLKLNRDVIWHCMFCYNAHYVFRLCCVYAVVNSVFIWNKMIPYSNKSTCNMVTLVRFRIILNLKLCCLSVCVVKIMIVRSTTTIICVMCVCVRVCVVDIITQQKW